MSWLEGKREPPTSHNDSLVVVGDGEAEVLEVLELVVVVVTWRHWGT